MGIRYEQHSDLCGCDRCAKQWETEHPRPVFDEVQDPDILDCGCHCQDRCRCDEYEEPGDCEYDPMDDCGMGPDGQCAFAGSEHCDWECPRATLDKEKPAAS